jgi:lipopolysaccharide/colanic/teichoic acid biosynthesis glycosyltransferase
MINVLRGEMALVGPRPLTRESLEPLRTAKRYYLSARPGIVGVESIAEAYDAVSQYKGYALSWSFETDALILWDALRRLLAGGKLWRPDRPKLKVSDDAQAALARRRTTSSSS